MKSCFCSSFTFTLWHFQYAKLLVERTAIETYLYWVHHDLKLAFVCWGIVYQWYALYVFLYVQFPFGKLKGLPYIPRVHLSEGSLFRSPLKWLWSQEPVVRRTFIPKFLYSECCYVPKIPYSERPSTIWILCYEGSLVRSSSGPKGAMFRTSIFRKSPLPHTSSTLRRSFSPKFPPF